MPALPQSNGSLLVRTDFSDDDAWRRLVEHVEKENADGFQAYVDFVDDAAFADSDWAAVRAAVPPNDEGASVLFVADRTALATDDHPILVIDLMSDSAPFRCVADELWSVDNNLNISNMDWEDFAGAVDADGVFRGF